MIAPTTGMGCTAMTNVASALGRALGVPTRHVAGILTGEALQTHSVNEFLIGTPHSWVRVEPQNGETVAQDYMVVLRVVPASDEGPASIDRERWGAPGVPMYALVEAIDDRARLDLEMTPDHFPGCPRCDNAARRLATLQDTSMDRIERLDARARAQWEREQAQWIDGTRSPAVARIRTRAATIASLDDLERWLDDIDST